MKITQTPLIYPYTSSNTPKTKLKENIKFYTNNFNRPLNFYMDYNISFCGRSPENFYAQDFNRENMPSSMQKYLNYDYEQRQHIPPEQIMQEVFKYLKTADNFEEVKKLYPNEELFKNLHENKKNNKTSILAEIKMAKEISDTPLFKDGSDNFGMYLLRKIYIEGKTIKEISKDFLEKDINDDYKGIITKPITYETTSAYGIKYPKLEFWHSFIATREDYKKFFITLPKNMVDPNRIDTANEKFKTADSTNTTNKNSSTKIQEQRKFNIKRYKKEQITNDIKNSKGDLESVKIKIRKRFAKDDPEASFIIKYFSPIMTVAAERVHLSEEMRYFNEYEKSQGKSLENQYMFERFWKSNPQIRTMYAKAITDTIEMFEDIYGAGGFLPINSELEKITPDSKNQKIIDYVSPEFLELLNYTQKIEQNRIKEYEKHDELQKQWQQHFIDRYGNAEDEIESNMNLSYIDEDEELADELLGVKAINPEFSIDKLKDLTDTLNTDTFKLKGINGEDISITRKLDEEFKDYLDNEIQIYPSSFGIKYKNNLLNDSEISPRFKLSLAARKFKNLINDDKIMSDEEFQNALNNIRYRYAILNAASTLAASAAMADTIGSVLKNRTPQQIYKLYAFEYNLLNPDDKESKEIFDILKSNKKFLNELYLKYTQPLTRSEINKISLVIMDELSKYNGNDNSLDSNDKETLLMLKEITNQVKFKKKILKDAISVLLPDYRYSRFLLNKNTDPQLRTVKFEYLLSMMLKDLRNQNISKTPILINIINKDTLLKHKSNISDERFNEYIQSIHNMDPQQLKIFELSTEQLIELDKFYQKNNK